MLIQAIAISLFYGFLLFEWLGIVSGGLIAPAYIALSFNNPLSIALCLCTAFVTMFLIRLLSSITILYGRRRFILAVLLAFALQWTLGALVMGTEFGKGRVDIVGYIIPGLLANEMERQGVGRTQLALLLLSIAVRITLVCIEKWT